MRKRHAHLTITQKRLHDTPQDVGAKWRYLALRCGLWVCTGDIAAFGSDLGVRQSVSLATRLDWCLSDAQEWVEQRNDEDYALASKSDAEVGTRDSEMTPDSTDKEDSLASRVKVDRKDSVSATAARCMREDSAGRRRRWILKPSTLNKGAALAFGEGFEPLRKAIHESPDIREWVLQEYVERPLLVQGRKFHLRAYVLAGSRGFRYSVKTPRRVRVLLRRRGNPVVVEAFLLSARASPTLERSVFGARCLAGVPVRDLHL